jgi:hypothetical protein
MAEQQMDGEKAQVQASLDRVGGERRFQILNAGPGSALDVRFSVASEREKNSPVSAHDLETLFPVAELEAGEAIAVGAIITPGTGLHFRGVVTWRNVDGSEEEGVFYMSA